MITHNDQLDLLRLIANNISNNISCYAFGGTAMMFYGYKDETKDIDLLFEKEEDRQEFIKALEELGFEKSDPIKIYIPEKLRDKNRPVMYKRDETRFDLFVKKIFKTVISPKIKEDLYAVHEFKEENTLKINVLRKEHIVLLKAVTDRQNDFDDIKKIISKDKNFDWQYLVDEAIWQHEHGDTWALLDTEKTLKELKKYFFIEEKYFKQIYKAVKKK
ncbi:hypothetical protein KY348_03925 [Candidatus Woesearchaeota archaeon]|nr:hypothetical protein [Candidatus Woesearchaeota archaeon]